MTYSQWDYQNIALAAVAQSALLVHNLAVTGKADSPAMAACVNPLLIFNPSSVAEVYPQVSHLMPGLRTLQEVFGNENMQTNAEVIGYVLGMLVLRQKLMANDVMGRRIRDSLARLSPLPEDVGPDLDLDEFYSRLATVYQQTISSFNFRIHVKGNAEYLKDESIANRIRALLLAGIRSAVLWYQLGGRRWHLLVYRKRIRQNVTRIRRNLLTIV
jgi:high frequency lysogenization protein